MEALIVIGVIAIVALILIKKKKDKKSTPKPVQPAPTPTPAPTPAPTPPVSGPCDDKRDGTNFRAYMTQIECNKHGYFWCPIAKACMPSSINVNDCGKPPHLM